MRSLYLSNNRISDFSPALKLSKLWSLYLDHNQITKLDGVASLKSLTTLSAGNNALTDRSPLNGRTRLHFLFLENNKIANLDALVSMASTDYKGPKNFAPFLRLYMKGNPIDGATDSRLKFARLMKFGVGFLSVAGRWQRRRRPLPQAGQHRRARRGALRARHAREPAAAAGAAGGEARAGAARLPAADAAATATGSPAPGLACVHL